VWVHYDGQVMFLLSQPNIVSGGQGACKLSVCVQKRTHCQGVLSKWDTFEGVEMGDLPHGVFHVCIRLEGCWWA